MILHPFNPTSRLEDQHVCWQRLDEIRRWHSVWDVPCWSDHDYERAVIASWGRDDLIICEHDIALQPFMIDAFRNCREPICVQAYQIYPASTGQPVPHYCHAYHRIGSRRWIDPGEEWAHESGIGLVRFRLDAQLAIDPEELRSSATYDGWKTLDQRLFWVLRRREMLFHVHWPEVAHHHR